MTFSRFYVDSDLSIHDQVILPVASAHYIKNVLRTRSGQQVILFNGKDSAEFLSRIEFQGKRTVAIPVARTVVNLESTLVTTLIQALGKSEHIDLIMQKATELGVNNILLFNSQRTQTHLKGARLDKKMTHWKGITISACEQCGRNTLPTVSFMSSLQDCLTTTELGNKILLDFKGQSVIDLQTTVNPATGFTMLTGAEGGLTGAEIQLALNHDFVPCTLGPRILRMETAAISILTLIQHYFGDL